MGHKPKMTPQRADEYTRLAAEKRARELWGQCGTAWHHCYSRRGDADYCRVGLGVGDVRDLWKPFGRGKDWESAFLDAQRRGYCT